MTKTELIQSIKNETGLPASQIAKIINSAIDIIKKKVADGGKVRITDFGTFAANNRAERNGRNPQTGESITIAAHKAPHFKAGKAFKEAVKK